MMNALNSRRQNYTEALTAYNKGDCQLANQNFNQVLESPKFLDKFDRYNAKVTEYKTTCDYFIKVNKSAQTQLNNGSPDLALIELLNFPKKYRDDRLTTFVKDNISTLFLDYTSNGLSSETSCTEIDYITNQKIIPTEDSHLPYFYRNCANIYLENGETTKAQETTRQIGVKS